MLIDHTRRELLRIASLAGIGALLPDTTLVPAGQAATHPAPPPQACVQVNGWLLRSSDR